VEGNLSFEKCGVEIANGRSVEKQFPWLVKIHIKDKINPLHCYGAVISDRAIVTCEFYSINYSQNYLKFVFQAAFCIKMDTPTNDIEVSFADNLNTREPEKVRA